MKSVYTLKTDVAIEPVSLDELKSHLRITGTAEDTYLSSLIATARKAAEGNGRLYGTQTWEIRYERFADPLELPVSPVTEIASIGYRDEAGDLVALDPDDFEISEDSLYHIGSTSLPAVMYRIMPVVLEVTAGRDPVPDLIHMAILQIAAYLYENREAAAVSMALSSVSYLLNSDRRWSL